MKSSAPFKIVVISLLLMLANQSFGQNCDHMLCPIGCVSTSVQVEFGPTIDAPAIGFNGKIDIPGNNINYANPDFRAAVLTIQPEALRFPGGTVSGSWTWNSFRVANNSSIREYFIEDIPNPQTAWNYAMLEGDHLKVELLKAITVEQVNFTFNTTLISSNIRRINMNNVFKEKYFSRKLAKTSIEPWGLTVGSETIITKSKLYDFLSLCALQFGGIPVYGEINAGITPVLVLQMSDPLTFAMRSTSQNSISTISTNFPITNSQPDLLKIKELAIQNIERQLYKIHYVLKQLQSTAPAQSAYNQLLASTISSTWSYSTFAEKFSQNNLNPIPGITICFELGNELYGDWSRKYFPPQGFLGNPFNLNSTGNAELYAEICVEAIKRIKLAYPSAKIALIAGNRNGTQDWTSRVYNAYLNSCGSNCLDYDAFTLHFYPNTNNPSIIGLLSGTEDSNDLLSLTAETENLLGLEETTINPTFDIGATNKDIWITEYDINSCEYSGTQIMGTWFQTLANYSFYNTVHRRNPALQNYPENGDLYNYFGGSSSIPNLKNVKMILTQTIGVDENRGTIQYNSSTNEYTFGALAFLSILQNTLQESDNERHGRPFIFKINNSTNAFLESGFYDDDEGAGCDSSTNSLPFFHPHLYGWEVIESLATQAFGVPQSKRFFIVNSSENFYTIDNPYVAIQSNGSSVPAIVSKKVFSYSGNGISPIILTSTEIDALFQPFSTINNNTVCVSTLGGTGAFNIPPYSVLIGNAILIPKNKMNGANNNKPESLLSRTNEFTVTFSNDDLASDYEIIFKIHDMTGRLIDEKRSVDNTYQLPTSMSSGIYLVSSEVFDLGLTSTLKIFVR